MQNQDIVLCLRGPVVFVPAKNKSTKANFMR